MEMIRKCNVADEVRRRAQHRLRIRNLEQLLRKSTAEANVAEMKERMQEMEVEAREKMLSLELRERERILRLEYDEKEKMFKLEYEARKKTLDKSD